MKKIDINVAVCILSMFCLRASSLQYQLSNDDNSNQRTNANAKETWQPMSQMSNWIIMKGGGEETTAAPLMNQGNNHRSLYGKRNLLSRLENVGENAYTNIWRRKQQNPVETFPTHYYKYNHSTGGNYQNVKIIEPYFVTINKMRARTTSKIDSSDSNANSDRLLRHHVGSYSLPKSPLVDAIDLPKDVLENIVPLQENIESKMGISRRNDFNRNQDTTKGSSDDVITNNGIDYEDKNDDEDSYPDRDIINETNDDENLNEIFLPLQQTLDKVIYFCDMAKRFISDTDVEDLDDDTTNEANQTNEVATNAKSTDEVQGRHSVSASSLSSSTPLFSSLSLSTTSAAMQSSTKSSSALTPTQPTQSQSPSAATSHSSIGTGRKSLKKKLSRFILPLLLAYKLKFLTLIPVLIGGLTLLVGTTGLAGFFFAMFTAVMSLKSSGRGKYKKHYKMLKQLYPLLIGAVLAKIVVVPLILKMLTALSTSSFIMAKIALVASGLLALKWIFADSGKERAHFEIVHLPVKGGYSHSNVDWDDMTWSGSNYIDTTVPQQRHKYIPLVGGNSLISVPKGIPSHKGLTSIPSYRYNYENSYDGKPFL